MSMEADPANDYLTPPPCAQPRILLSPSYKPEAELSDEIIVVQYIRRKGETLEVLCARLNFSDGVSQPKRNLDSSFRKGCSNCSGHVFVEATEADGQPSKRRKTESHYSQSSNVTV
ncbi:hypothetical protein VNI00_016317 [Paramarasmius palmivorus]|uniref:Uncharacterized protein n=1 Tax=Paramarasmius palmivorus TaxID=297713 RepID=A0AAW0AV88_9AGAR